MATTETGSTPPEIGKTVIELEGIHKNFGRVQALRGVDLSLRDGEIHGLVGDNGSGKSTLVKVMVGVHQPNEGTIRVRGKEREVSNPKEARSLGISTVYQDLALVDERTVADNMFLGRYQVKHIGGVFPIVDWEEMRTTSKSILRNRLNIDIDPTSRVQYLSGGERQSIAIARALVTDPEIVIMDEPTSALSTDSAERVQELIGDLNEEGLSVLIISHNMDEIFTLTDRITVLDNGLRVGTVETEEVSRSDIVHMMVEGKMPAGIRDVHEY